MHAHVTRTLAVLAAGLACGFVALGAEGTARAVPLYVPPAAASDGTPSNAPAAPPAPAAVPYPSPYPPPSASPPAPVTPGAPPFYPPPPGYQAPNAPYYSYPSYAAAPSSASEPSIRRRQRPGANTHDGFYLSLGLGVLQGYNAIHGAAAKVEANGTGVAFTASIGGALTRNVILCARLHLSNAETHFVNRVSGYDVESATFNSGLAGACVVYYLGDTNVFFAATLGLTLFDVQDTYNSQLVDTKARFGAGLEIGKEWWVSPSWGLGGVLKGIYGTAKDVSSNNAGVWTTLTLALMLSATYN